MLLIPVVALTLGAIFAPQDAVGTAKASSPLVGHWVADISQSKVNPKFPMKTAALTIAVSGDSVSLTDVIVDSAGKETTHGTVTFKTDGGEHPHDELVPGLVVAARWLSSHALETVASKGGQVVHRIRYEVSADGQTLSAIDVSLDQVIVFRRN